jgi:cystathionine gamma-synthase
MSTITILSKQPPGGRCTLYIHYAEAISQHLGVGYQVKYCESDGEDGNQPPALMIGENLIEPSDGVIVSPEDLINGLRDSVTENELEELHQLLDTVQEQLMEEWSNE